MFWMLYAFFWVIPQRLNSICHRFRTLCLFHLHRRLWRWNRQSGPKLRHIKFRCGEITQMKAYNISIIWKERLVFKIKGNQYSTVIFWSCKLPILISYSFSTAVRFWWSNTWLMTHWREREIPTKQIASANDRRWGKAGQITGGLVVGKVAQGSNILPPPP
jgi:hypothetical protein